MRPCAFSDALSKKVCIDKVACKNVNVRTDALRMTRRSVQLLPGSRSHGEFTNKVA